MNVCPDFEFTKLNTPIQEFGYSDFNHTEGQSGRLIHLNNCYIHILLDSRSLFHNYLHSVHSHKETTKNICVKVFLILMIQISKVKG